MSDVRKASLQLHEDVRFQLLEWRLSTATWLLLLATMAAAVLGLFGDGLFSRTTVDAAGGRLAVEYERFARFGRTTRLTVYAAGTGSAGRWRSPLAGRCWTPIGSSASHPSRRRRAR